MDDQFNDSKYLAKIKKIYLAAIKEAARLGALLNYDPSKPFSFKDYPVTNKKINALLAQMTSDIELTINNGTIAAWAASNAKNDRLLSYIAKQTGIHPTTLAKKYDFGARNQEGLQAFQKRKVDGLGLSDRVWKSTSESKELIETALDIGLSEGKSAAALSRDVRSALLEPNKLFRKVNGKLSKAAKNYNPGQGVYRSSYKNAMRLTRTETNMAYRTADHDRWQQFDFVKGIEVKLSNNPHHCDVCESLAGKYPKDFKFVGWHPQCRCYAIPILLSADEYNDFELTTLKGEQYEVKGGVEKPPKSALDWFKKNEDRVKSAKSLPYFIKDNKDYFKLGVS